MIDLILRLIFCHLLGDYVLQNDYIAKTKGENWYHLFAHCALYCLPFYVVFGVNINLVIMFISHIVIDALKARYKKIDYTFDQIIHYLVCLIYLV